MNKTLLQLWEQQTVYNQRVAEIQQRSSADWMQTYILGLMSECGQLLDAMRWKQHRLETKEEFGPNVGEELADITKYVLSMWILMGNTPEEMLDLCWRKGDYMNYLFTQEVIPLADKVIVFDIDDVLTETRQTLVTYLQEHITASTGTINDLHLDVEYLLRYDVYRTRKTLFEKEGGYLTIPEVYPTRKLFSALQDLGYSVVCYTARPVEIFKQIRRDTFEWFSQREALPSKILFGRETRITYCTKLLAEGRKVILVEDEPTLVRRAVNSKIPVICPKKDHNAATANFTGGWEELIQKIQELYGDIRNTGNANCAV